MAEKVLIMGESGTGKSTSMRNLDPKKTAIVNPVGKPLPFKGKFDKLNGETDSGKIVKWMKEQVKKGKKVIVVDDFQYILSIPYMNRIKEAGWDKWNDFGANYFEIVDATAELPNDVIVYYMTHTETLDNGITTIKLIGKLLREKITIEGLFTIVLRTSVVDGKYYFLTQNSGKDTVKSPMDMFPSYAVDNDLAYIDDKIRNYYEIGEHKTDEEIAEQDKAVAAEDVTKEDTTGRKKRGRGKKAEEPKAEETKTPDFMNIPEDSDEEVPFDEAVSDDKEPEKPKSERKSRRAKKEESDTDAEQEEVPDEKSEMTGAKAAFDKAKAKYNTKSDPEPNAERTENTENTTAGRRTRRKRG